MAVGQTQRTEQQSSADQLLCPVLPTGLTIQLPGMGSDASCGSFLGTGKTGYLRVALPRPTQAAARRLASPTLFIPFSTAQRRRQAPQHLQRPWHGTGWWRGAMAGPRHSCNRTVPTSSWQ